MRRDLDRLAWAWMLLGLTAGAAHAALALLLPQLPLVADALMTLALLSPEAEVLVGLLVVGGGIVATLAPVALFGLVGLAVLDRRPWAVPLALVASVFAVAVLPPLGLLVVGWTLYALTDATNREKFRETPQIGWQLSALGSLHGSAVAELQAAPGDAVDLTALGEAGRTVWSGADRVAIVGADGREYLVDPQHPVTLGSGAVAVRVAVVPELPVRRLVWFGAQGSLVWLLTFLASSLLAEQGTIVWNLVKCPLFGVECPAPADQGSGAQTYTAEYLARLLRKDLAGEDQGVLERKLDRPDAERKITNDRFYLPAGNDGPITKMGGAADTAPDPVRTPKSEEIPVPKKKKKRSDAPKIAMEGAVPIPATPEHPDEDGAADADQDSPIPVGDDKADVPAPPAEEKEGWGVQDWYDEEDKRVDNMEIETMIRAAKYRLRIDPDDPGALSVLSYYQYLAEDYAAAEGTYDKYISLLPEDPAGYNNKALVYKRRGEYQKEEGLYRVALALEPNDPTALNNLAVNLAHQKRYEEALAVMTRLEVLDPNDAYAELHRAKIYADMGNDERALFYLDKSLRMMQELDTLHHIEFRQDIRVDPSFSRLRETERFRAVLKKYYGKDSPLQDP